MLDQHILIITLLTGTYYVTNCQDVSSRDHEEEWLQDRMYYDEYMNDAPVLTKLPDICPPVPESVPGYACGVKPCDSDEDCYESYRCCFNGCKFTCVPEVQAAPVVDWVKEPRRSRSGISWLQDKPNVGDVKEPCSTSPVEEDEDPLLCPQGYFCHVEIAGDPKRGLPNKGFCVEENDDLFVSAEKKGRELTVQHMCFFNNYVLLDGARMKTKDKSCHCKKGFLSCASRQFKKRWQLKIVPKN